MKKHQNQVILLVTVVVLLFLSANIVWFQFKPNPIFLPQNSSLPSKELVYTTIDSEDNKIFINFRNLRGKDIEQRSIIIPTYIINDTFPVKYYSKSLGRIITWSVDGESIGVISPAGQTNGQGYPIIIHNDGIISYCDPKKSIIVKDGIKVLSNSTIMAIQVFLDSETQYLVTYNLDSCEVVNYIYKPGIKEILQSFSYSKNGWLAIEIDSSLYWQTNHINDDFVGIRLLNPINEIILEIDNAKNPSISLDEKKIAYLNNDGEICISTIDIYSPVCHGKAKSQISWSPNDDYIVYSNSSYEITMQNVLTREIETITNGLFPNWRP